MDFKNSFDIQTMSVLNGHMISGTSFNIKHTFNCSSWFIELWVSENKTPPYTSTKVIFPQYSEFKTNLISIAKANSDTSSGVTGLNADN